jgi:hypothetical protein
VGVELDARAVGGHAQPELDVLDRRLAELLGVEAAVLDEGVAANSAESGPERARGSGRALVHVVMQEVAEDRDRPLDVRIVVVGAEDGCEPWIRVESPADFGERVAMREHVGVDEDHRVRGGAQHARVPRCGRAGARRLPDDDDLVGRVASVRDRGEAALERGGLVRCRHDRREGDHANSDRIPLTR